MRGYPGGDTGVQQPCAVHVSGKAVGLRDLYYLIERALLRHRAAADSGGLFDTDHRLRRLVAAARMQGFAKGLGRKLSVGARQRRDLESAKRGMGAAFAGDDVG